MREPTASRFNTFQTFFQTFHPSQWCVHLDPGKEKWINVWNLHGFHEEIYLSDLSSNGLVYCEKILNNNYCHKKAWCNFDSEVCWTVIISYNIWREIYTVDTLAGAVSGLSYYSICSECFSFWNHSSRFISYYTTHVIIIIIWL